MFGIITHQQHRHAFVSRKSTVSENEPRTLPSDPPSPAPSSELTDCSSAVHTEQPYLVPVADLISQRAFAPSHALGT
ncbi:hypothetical protein M419DRAFT_121842 [Trichoderma reesei RUT C-30]|jgi:hypothetical protein|uniref:Uncharacterized protein n=1 Tax=Hypocrea jecorina (strain ATCC 56765 / BCRC 32924 / NRRL 11460 / Rut C-30) TaxID=1344414 RepID=A0A024SNM5_HYPJR|nr:hypothetical protein M419DRAFT_121842 [Trichoderma reesei RUT C-30]